MDKYKFTDHKQMPQYLKDYVVGCSNAKRAEDISIYKINDFLNAKEEWKSDPLYRKNYREGRF